ncbi:MAG: 2-C-methyl-D-erythritol 2,4-cyclodiphosphate synthase [Candidatus Eremiobacteraeota bacterium]|nr:2-C-methyl-D-erythritol 2,4-cyclodiphosphate synthase [Candidatus Eremiobacteraeota bacterium]MBC5826489.1 2-C-methyl-D-erythritol 2,4-cyclodiphosphate synthase [Candidatus Eremiobacteraeota bacterium]
MRVGFGFDAHALVVGRPLILAGVAVPFERGLAGFSDADVATHAVVDALLGAAGLGDCGTHFPAGDNRYAGADSVALLRRSVELVRHAGLRICNVDCTIVAEAPPLAEYVERMRQTLAAAMQLDVSLVSVKAKRTEGLGFTGEGKGMAAYSAACLQEEASR